MEIISPDTNELTSQQVQPTFWIKEHFQIKEEAIKANTYLHPLSLEETVANQLADLGFGYYRKYNVYDEFTLACAETSLKHFQFNPTAIIIKAQSLSALLDRHLESNGGLVDEFTIAIDDQLESLHKQLDATYWTQETTELRTRWEENGYQVEKWQ